MRHNPLRRASVCKRCGNYLATKSAAMDEEMLTCLEAWNWGGGWNCFVWDKFRHKAIRAVRLSSDGWNLVLENHPVSSAMPWGMFSRDGAFAAGGCFLWDSTGTDLGTWPFPFSIVYIEQRSSVVWRCPSLQSSSFWNDINGRKSSLACCSALVDHCRKSGFFVLYTGYSSAR